MLNKWEELRLIARCVAGDDRQAFGQLVEEYNDGLRRFLLNLTLGDASIDVQQCLKILSEPERTAVLLFYLDDRPIKEISAIMQMPQGTVKSHLSRAKAKMATMF